MELPQVPIVVMTPKPDWRANLIAGVGSVLVWMMVALLLINVANCRTCELPLDNTIRLEYLAAVRSPICLRRCSAMQQIGVILIANGDRNPCLDFLIGRQEVEIAWTRRDCVWSIEAIGLSRNKQSPNGGKLFKSVVSESTALFQHFVYIVQHSTVGGYDQTPSGTDMQRGRISTIFEGINHLHMGACGVEGQGFHDSSGFGHIHPWTMRDRKLPIRIMQLISHRGELSFHYYELINGCSRKDKSEQNYQPVSNTGTFDQFAQSHDTLLFIVSLLFCIVGGVPLFLATYGLAVGEVKMRAFLLCLLWGAALFALVFAFAHASYGENVSQRPLDSTSCLNWIRSTLSAAIGV